MKHKSSILLSLFFLLFLLNLAHAAIPPSAYFYILYEGNEIPDAELYGEFLSCEEKDYNPERDVFDKELISQLNISLYDSTNNCYWKPFKYTRWGYCENGTCDFFPIPDGKTRFAVYISSLDQVFITNEVEANVDKNYYKVELFSDGSAYISTTSRGEVDKHSNIDTDENSPLKSRSLYVVLFFSFIALIFLILHRKSKK